MRKLKVFESITSNGYYAGPGGDMSWTYGPAADPEFEAFVRGNASGSGVLLFGRVTYEMMASYWPTPHALERDPIVAEGMNRAQKLVFSRHHRPVAWNNASLVEGDAVEAVRRLKQEAGRDMVVLGSGSLAMQLMAAGLVDELQLVIKPVVLGSGVTLFEGIPVASRLELTFSRVFGDGNVVLNYVPLSREG